MSEISLILRKKQYARKNAFSENIIKIGGFILLSWIVIECLADVIETQRHYNNHYVKTFENLTGKRLESR